MNTNLNTMPKPFSLTHVPFDFFPATSNEERKIRDWKLHEANRNNSELLTRAAEQANKARFMN